MDPNSSHQVWSKWRVKASLPRRSSHEGPAFFRAIRGDAGRFLNEVFGSVGSARVTVTRTTATEHWLVEALVEGAPVQEHAFRAQTIARLKAHWQAGFGPAAVITADAGLLAGETEHGNPPAQLLILPHLPVSETSRV